MHTQSSEYAAQPSYSHSHSQFPVNGNGHMANHAYLRHRGSSSNSNNASSFAMHNSMSGSINVNEQLMPDNHASSFYNPSMPAHAYTASSPPKPHKAIRASPVVPMPHSASAGLSPIRGGGGGGSSTGHAHAHDTNLTLPLNVSQTQFANDTRLTQLTTMPHAAVPANGGAVEVDQTEIAIIGFPTGEAPFIHRKFRSYGTVLRSEWKSNTLFIKYEHAQNGQRALAENAKWIHHENQHYMVAVIFAKYAESNPLDVKQQHSQTNKGGRFINFNEMYNNSFKSADANIPKYFGLHHNHNIERPAIQSGTKHIFWKIFHFITSGW